MDGRAQFSINNQRDLDGSVQNELALLVGALRVDGSKKSPYLPDGPRITGGLLRTMEWLDSALLDGAIEESGVIFNGSTQLGANALEKSFQAFFNF